MELEKKTVQFDKLKEQAIYQMTFDDDFIVPDTNPDIGQIVMSDGRVELEETRRLAGRAKIKGRLYFKMMYNPEYGGDVFVMRGALPFDEAVNMEQLDEKDYLHVKPEIDDLTVEMINSRKISVRAVITFKLSAEEVSNEEVARTFNGDENCEVITGQVDISKIAVLQKDTLRVKLETEISSGQPNVGRIIWDESELRNVDVKAGDGELVVNGEINVYIMYAAEDERIPVQWLERSIPFTGNVELPYAVQEMIPFVEVNLAHADINLMPDNDGETRIFTIDGLLELDIRLFEDDRVTYLSDIYSTAADISPVMKDIRMESVLVKNISKFKANGRIAVNSDERMLQICRCRGNVKIDDSEITDEGVRIEGALLVNVLFMTSDDKNPMRAVKGAIPFSYIMEAKNIDDGCSYQIKTCLEQLSAMLLGNDELEIKASILAELLVRREMDIPVVSDIEIKPFDLERIAMLPGISGYVVREGDTLWKIAKKYHAGLDSIREINGLKSYEVYPGDRLIIVKQVEGAGII
ncbi:MAG: DUF3794 domain-containing protein [Lachnospiraceae bacterium]|nr:DUF3794 domain-containing protein [Lachnospiraceae bacterium]